MTPFGYKLPPNEEIELMVQCAMFKISDIEYEEYMRLNHTEW